MSRIKIIAALDGLNVSESTIDYSVYLAKMFHAHIVAVFLEEIDYHSVSDDKNAYSFSHWADVEVVEKEDRQLRNMSAGRVKSHFETRGVDHTIHKDGVIAIEALLDESHYADMIIIDGDERFSNRHTSKPSPFIRRLLADSGCPVLVLPKKFRPIEKVVFCYDGSPSSVYAIRQFTYLFNSGDDQVVEMMMVTDDPHSTHFPHHTYLKELLKHKYSVVLQSIVKSEAHTEALIQHFQEEDKSCLLVLGSYQRSTLSRWLHESTADALIREINIPLFVAHK